MKFIYVLALLFFIPLSATAQDKVLNIYAWANEIPESVIRAFEKESGIKVNITVYGNNEMMYAKLRASKNVGYDIVMPSSYFVDRMQRQHMLAKLDKSKLPNLKNINPKFLNPSYDPHSDYSVPHVMGITGIFLNTHYFSEKSISKWSDLWDKRFNSQLLLLDDIREIFSIGLLSLGYSANDRDPEHIKAAYLKLKALMKNVKVFTVETVTSIIIDEDATVGTAWNADAYKASQENKHIAFVYPKEGFVMWVDNFSIPYDAPHKEAAYAFINFVLRADIGRDIALITNYPTPNLAAQQLLPAPIRNNPIIYPPQSVLKRGQFQIDVGDETTALYAKYWEALKMGG
jgi:spermidine/putrescine transport system substrate-binding protein